MSSTVTSSSDSVTVINTENSEKQEQKQTQSQSQSQRHAELLAEFRKNRLGFSDKAVSLILKWLSENPDHVYLQFHEYLEKMDYDELGAEYGEHFLALVYCKDGKKYVDRYDRSNYYDKKNEFGLSDSYSWETWLSEQGFDHLIGYRSTVHIPKL
jgi:hypothetical protein